MFSHLLNLHRDKNRTRGQGEMIISFVTTGRMATLQCIDRVGILLLAR